jgi:zinc-binding dehydrogenase
MLFSAWRPRSRRRRTTRSSYKCTRHRSTRWTGGPSRFLASFVASSASDFVVRSIRRAALTWPGVSKPSARPSRNFDLETRCSACYGARMPSMPAVPVAGLTALQALREARVQPGQTILINGAGGGVGTFAVQIAKASGAEVTAVCSTRNQDVARSIGADHVIDYTREDFTKSGRRYDVIIAANGYHSIFAYKRALNANGIYVVLGGAMLQMLQQVVLGPTLLAFPVSNTSQLPRSRIKSMRTADAHLRRGVAATILDHLIAEARQRINSYILI